MTKYKIYTLNNPLTGEIRYVGQTCQTLKSRLKKHIRAKDKSHRVNWIQSLLTKGISPEIKLICETNNHDNCNELEMFYIKKYRDEGKNLINMTNGGDGSIGFKHTDETKGKMSKITKKRMSNPDNIAEISLKIKEFWESNPDKKKNMILNQPNRKKIGQYNLSGDLISTFLSLREIERELGYFRANISPCIKGKFKQAYGYIWKYV